MIGGFIPTTSSATQVKVVGLTLGVNVMIWLLVPEQMVWPVGSVGESETVGLGLTMIWYSERSPAQTAPPLVNVAVT